MSKPPTPSPETWSADAPLGDSPETLGEPGYDADAGLGGPTLAPRRARYAPTGELLGVGGLGRVDAVRDRDLGREVARKELHRVGPADRERFLREARVTAQLEHPGVVPIYELGEDEDGRPYYTMRRIRGRTFGEALDDCSDLQDRLALLPAFIAACQAVAFAHARGVIHRDLKPDNMMVGEFGEALVVDWGLAKVMADGDVDFEVTGSLPPSVPKGAQLTRVGAAMGTPAYMSPEQARGDSAVIDARSDVWGLGAILFELLAGRGLFPGLPGDTTVERLRRGELEPLDAALAGAPADLVAVVQKSLMPDPDARYFDAGELAADLLRWERGGLVKAYQYTRLEVLARSIRRNRARVIGASVAVLSLLVAATGIAATGAYSYVQIRTERDRAVAAETLAAQREADARGRLARSLSGAAHGALTRQDFISAQVLALGSLELEETPEARGVLVAATSVEQPRLVGQVRVDGPCRLPTLSPRGAALCWSDRGLEAREVLAEAPTAMVPLDVTNLDAWRIAWSPQSTRFAAIQYSGAAFWADAASGEAHTLPVESLNNLIFLDEDRLVVAAEQKRLGILDLRTGDVRWSSRQAVARFDGLALLDDGSVMVSSVVDPLRRWDPRSDTWTDVSPGWVAPMLGASLDGEVFVAGGGWGGASTPLHLSDHGELTQLDGPSARSAIGVSRDGDRVFAATPEEVTIWDGPDWQIRFRVPADASILGASMSGDGQSLLISESDGDLRLWRVPADELRRPLDGGGTVWEVRATKDGELLASGGNEGVLRVWDAKTGGMLREVALDPGGIGYMALDGHDAVVAANTRGLVRVGLESLDIQWEAPLNGVVNDVQRLPDGRLVVAFTSGHVALHDQVGKELWRVRVADWAGVASPGPAGDVIVGARGAVVHLDPATGAEMRRIPHPSITDILLPQPDGTIFVGEMGSVALIDADGQTLRSFGGQYVGATTVLERQGELLLTGDDGGTLCLWDLKAQPLACWRAHQSSVWRGVFLPGRVASGGADGAVRLWDVSALQASPNELREVTAERFGLVPGDGRVAEVD